jgi:hypothetical protein
MVTMILSWTTSSTYLLTIVNITHFPFICCAFILTERVNAFKFAAANDVIPAIKRTRRK